MYGIGPYFGGFGGCGFGPFGFGRGFPFGGCGFGGFGPFGFGGVAPSYYPYLYANGWGGGRFW